NFEKINSIILPPADLKTWYLDQDKDGYGNPVIFVLDSVAPAGYVLDHSDCNDSNATIHPGASETCNHVDDNCNGQIDEGVQTTFYADVDHDGYGNLSSTISDCSAPAGYVTNSTDCDDTNVTVHPGGTEICNGLDDDCSGTVDDHIISDASLLWQKSFGGS